MMTNKVTFLSCVSCTGTGGRVVWEELITTPGMTPSPWMTLVHQGYFLHGVSQPTSRLLL